MAKNMSNTRTDFTFVVLRSGQLHVLLGIFLRSFKTKKIFIRMVKNMHII